MPPETRHRSLFLVGALVLIALWLPPFVSPIQPADLPAWARELFGIRTGGASPWLARWDYLIVPALFLYAATIAWKSRPSAAEAGLTLRHFGAALRWLLLPTLAAAALALLIAAATGGLQASMFSWDSRFWKRLIPIPAFFQQAAIQLYFHRQLRPWLGNGRATAVALTLFFVALHAPNPGLMLGTLLGMYFWARCYQRHPNLYALALSHAFLSALFMSVAPKCLLPSVSVGRRFVEKGLVQGWWGF